MARNSSLAGERYGATAFYVQRHSRAAYPQDPRPRFEKPQASPGRGGSSRFARISSISKFDLGPAAGVGRQDAHLPRVAQLGGVAS
jgi:hypothetical protein